MKAAEYLICPDCGKKGVTLHLKPQEDYWGCRYCDWEAYTEADNDFQVDVHERQRLTDANPPDAFVKRWEAL